MKCTKWVTLVADVLRVRGEPLGTLERHRMQRMQLRSHGRAQRHRRQATAAGAFNAALQRTHFSSAGCSHLNWLHSWVKPVQGVQMLIIYDSVEIPGLNGAVGRVLLVEDIPSRWFVTAAD